MGSHSAQPTDSVPRHPLRGFKWECPKSSDRGHIASRAVDPFLPSALRHPSIRAAPLRRRVPRPTSLPWSPSPLYRLFTTSKRPNRALLHSNKPSASAKVSLSSPAVSQPRSLANPQPRNLATSQHSRITHSITPSASHRTTSQRQNPTPTHLVLLDHPRISLGELLAVLIAVDALSAIALLELLPDQTGLHGLDP